MVTRQQAIEAVKTLIKWAGDDPNRKELAETPGRVVDSYKEFFSGYNTSLDKEISKTFDKENNFNNIIMLNDIRLESYCEHHMSPIIGRATVAYIPNDKIIGLSKIARIVDVYAKRLQIQERLIVEIADALDLIVKPKGIAILIEAAHHCITTRGIHKENSIMKTSHFTGCFKDSIIKQEFYSLLNKK